MVQDVKPEISVEGNLTLLNDTQVQVGSAGSGTVIINYKGIVQKQAITVGKTPAAKMMFVGDDKIRVASTNTYVLENAKAGVNFILDDPKSLVKAEIKDNICTIVVNEKNKLGTFTITAQSDGKEFSKVI